MAAVPGIPSYPYPYTFEMPQEPVYKCEEHGEYHQVVLGTCPTCKVVEMSEKILEYEKLLHTKGAMRVEKMGNDLFVMLNNNKYADLLVEVEARVAALVEHRHEYPIWPVHNGDMDGYERDYHGGIRKTYYGPTIFLIQTLRRLRNIS